MCSGRSSKHGSLGEGAEQRASYRRRLPAARLHRWRHPVTHHLPRVDLRDLVVLFIVTKLLFYAFEFVGERARIINLAQRFDNRGRIDGYGPCLSVGINAIGHQRLNVAVEDDAYEFVRLVYNRAAAVTADDVCVGNEIEMR